MGHLLNGTLDTPTEFERCSKSMGLWNWLATGYWEPPELEERQLETVVTDLGIAYETKIAELTDTADSAIPAVYRAGQFIADTTASLHMEQVDEASGATTRQTPDVLRRPDPTETYHDTIHKIVMSLIFRGNAYFRPLTFDRLGRPTTIQVLHPDDVTVSPDRNNLYPVYTWRGRPMARNRDIFHIAINLYPGQFTGLGPIAAARTLWTTMKAEANFQRQLIVDNAVPGGILHSQKPLTAAEAEEVRDVWESSHQGRKRIGVTSGVVEFKPLNIDPVDAQFIEARNFSVQEVGRLFGLSGFFLGVDSGSSMTYSTTESLFRLFLTQTLRPTYLERIEQTFSLILPRGRAARFNVDEILRPDIQTRYQAHEIALRAGFKTPNEVRAEEGYGPLPGGDTIQPAQTPEPAQSNGNGRIGTLA